MRKSLSIAVLAASVLPAGCLLKETTHNLYLSPDGRMTWLAVEANIRSDDSDPARRSSEEQGYLQAARGGGHGVGLGLAALDPSRQDTRIIRDERPFHVVTEADFLSIDHVVRRLLTELQVNGDVALRHVGGVTSLVVRVDAAAAAGHDAPSVSTPVQELAEGLERYQIVLTEGRFVAARGFSLRDGGTAAVPIETPWETIQENGGILEMSLAWRR
jgi:hypothetical protein